MSAGAEKKVSRLFLDRSGSSKKKASSKRKKPAPPRVHPLVVRILLVFILAVATVFMAFPMPQEYNTSLLLGDIAGQDVKADRDLMVQDRASTIEKRQTVRRNSPPVFDLYDHAAMGVQSRVHDVFSRGRAIFAAPPVTAPIFDDYDSVARPDDFELERLRQTFNSTFSFSSKDKHFDILAELQFSDQAERTILQLVIELVIELLNQGIVADKAVLLENSNRGIVLRRLANRAKRKKFRTRRFSPAWRKPGAWPGNGPCFTATPSPRINSPPSPPRRGPCSGPTWCRTCGRPKSGGASPRPTWPRSFSRSSRGR